MKRSIIAPAAATRIAVLLCLGTLGLVAGRGRCAAAEAKDDDAALLKDAQSAFAPLPKDMATDKYPFTPELVSLGRKLFFDLRVSVDGTVSCSRCHQPALYGIDGLPKSRERTTICCRVMRRRFSMPRFSSRLIGTASTTTSRCRPAGR